MTVTLSAPVMEHEEDRNRILRLAGRMRGLPSRRQWVSECVEHGLAPGEGRVHRYYANRGPMGAMWPVSSSMTKPSRGSEWRNLPRFCRVVGSVGVREADPAPRLTPVTSVVRGIRILTVTKFDRFTRHTRFPEGREVRLLRLLDPAGPASMLSAADLPAPRRDR
jgi:hypothetical protein